MHAMGRCRAIWPTQKFDDTHGRIAASSPVSIFLMTFGSAIWARFMPIMSMAPVLEGPSSASFRGRISIGRRRAAGRRLPPEARPFP